MLPPPLRDEVTKLLSGITGARQQIHDVRSLSGGSINDAYCLITPEGKYFLKYNRADAYPGMFEQEAMGLQILHDADELRVPEVLGYGTADKLSYLLLEYLEAAPKNKDFWGAFGRNLASLHRHSHDLFGLDHDNYIGSLKQYNKQHDNWVDFFLEERLNVQVEMAGRSGLLPPMVKRSFEGLYRRLGDIFPSEPPSLLHGDLWSGNYMVDDRGEACIIDPAVYYGFREMDIGMSTLFGQFAPEFYDAYNEAWPMAPGWHERIQICNLYPLMVHVNLFGAGYLGDVERIVGRFG